MFLAVFNLDPKGDRHCGLPRDGGGPDKKMVATLKELKVGSRLRVEWVFEERPRVVKVEVLKPADGK